jgi:hypothetical protein
MESISVKLDDGTGKVFDEALAKSKKSNMPECADLTIITKDDGTAEGNPIVMITFTVRMPDGTFQTVQAGTTAKCFAMAGAAVKGKYNL